MATPSQIAAADALSRAVHVVFGEWTALKLAVENEWAGGGTRDRALALLCRVRDGLLSAAVVHRDEIEHVRFAARSLRELAGPSSLSDIALYERAAPFPLSAARAKGRRFDVGSRRDAGLSEPFIEYVRTARSPQEVRGSRRRPEDAEA